MNKIILILYSAHTAGIAVPFSDKKYQRCYEAFYTRGESMGLHLCRAPLSWYDAEKNIFTRAWEFTDGQWRLSGPVQPDLVLDRTRGHSADDPRRLTIISRHRFVDDPAFTRFANDKYETSRGLPQHFKPYKKISHQTEFSDFLTLFSGEQLVIKPIVGSGGQGVHIVSRREALELDLVFPVIVQEFIDSSHGIPGITDTYHDLRMVFIGDELIYSYIRTPKEGSLLANLAQGGSMEIIPNAKLPVSLTPIIEDTQKLFARFPEKTYTIDVMFDPTGRPWIIEYNTMPGLYFPPEEQETMGRVYQRLLQEFSRYLESENPPIGTVAAVILFTPQAKENDQAFQKTTLRDAYTAFSRLAVTTGVTLYRASTRWYDSEQGQFRQAWHWNGNEWALTTNVVPDVIYDKAASTPETIPVKMSLVTRFPMVNNPEFTAHAGSKFLVSQTFKDCMKPYFFVTSPTELQAQLKYIPGDVVVVKPDRGNSGEGVAVLPKASLLHETPALPFLIQEFIDSSAGIPGVMQGLHDLRLIFSDEELVYAYYRTPKSGSYLANLARGGTQTMLTADQVPASVWPLVDTVQKYYANFAPKIYTIDLMFDPVGAPWIVELNTMPGLYPDESERPHIGKLYLAIIQALKCAVKKK